MDFAESQAYLLSLGNEVEAMKLGLENIRTLLAALGDPHESYLKVQVAGTNGKGSVCAFLDSICHEAGIRTGLYTSPHLVSITERIKIDGVEIGEGEFARIASFIRETAEGLLAEGKLKYTPTYFEQVTAIALAAFAEAKVELAILETGLGGRLDATTAAEAEIAAITRIDLDHQEYLGDTIEEIAAEKAAIIGRQTKSIIIGPQEQRARMVIAARLGELKSETRWSVQFVGKEDTPALPLGFPPERLGLLGGHQIENAAIAIRLAEALRMHFEISDDAVRQGLVNARHPGRLEYIGKFLLDGAHNIGGAKALREYLDEFEKQPITLIFGAMRDKDVAEFAKILWPRAERLILTQPSNPRAFTAEELGECVPNEVEAKNVWLTENVAEAVRLAEEMTPPGSMILVTGSLYLVGEVRKTALSR